MLVLADLPDLDAASDYGPVREGVCPPGPYDCVFALVVIITLIPLL